MKSWAFVLVLILAGCATSEVPGGETDEPSTPAGVDEAAGLDATRDIREAQSAYIATRRRYAQSMDELVEALMIPSEPSWADGGYRIRIRPTPAADGYSATVTPPPDSGSRSFYVDDSGVIRWAQGEAASIESAIVDGESIETPGAP